MAASSTHFVLSELRERVARLEGVATRRREVLPFGVPEIDRVLPGGGLALGALHEVAGGANGAVDGAAAALWAAGVAARTRPGPVVRHAPGSLRALARPGRFATRPGDLCRGWRRGGGPRLFRGRASSWRAGRGRCRTGAPTDDQLASTAACRRDLRHARHRHSPVAAPDRSHRLWTTDRRGQPLARLRAFLPAAAGPRRRPPSLAARIAARQGWGERRL